jgi:hypothetical protein
MPGLGVNVTSLGGLSSPNATTTANGFVAGGGPSDPNVGMVGGVGGSGGSGSSSSGGIVGSVSNVILPVSNGMGGVSVSGHHGQHGHGGLNGGPGGMAINSNANLNGVGGGGLSGGPTPSARIKAEHVDGGNLVLQRSPTSATSSGSYHTQ